MGLIYRDPSTGMLVEKGLDGQYRPYAGDPQSVRPLGGDPNAVTNSIRSAFGPELTGALDQAAANPSPTADVAPVGDAAGKATAFGEGAAKGGAFWAGAEAAQLPLAPFEPAILATGPPTFGIAPFVIHGAAGLLGGYAAEKGLSKAAEEAAKRNETLRRLATAADQNPGYQEAGNLATFGAGALRGGVNLLRHAGIVAEEQGTKAAAAHVGKIVAGGAAAGGVFEGVLRPAVDFSIEQTKGALGLKQEDVQSPTAQSVLTNMAIGALMPGLALKFKNYSTADVADIVSRAHEASTAGKPLTDVLSASEMDVLTHVGSKLAERQAQGQTGATDVSVKQSIFGGERAAGPESTRAAFDAMVAARTARQQDVVDSIARGESVDAISTRLKMKPTEVLSEYTSATQLPGTVGAISARIRGGEPTLGSPAEPPAPGATAAPAPIQPAAPAPASPYETATPEAAANRTAQTLAAATNNAAVRQRKGEDVAIYRHPTVADRFLVLEKPKPSESAPAAVPAEPVPQAQPAPEPAQPPASEALQAAADATPDAEAQKQLRRAATVAALEELAAKPAVPTPPAPVSDVNPQIPAPNAPVQPVSAAPQQAPVEANTPPVASVPESIAAPQAVTPVVNAPAEVVNPKASKLAPRGTRARVGQTIRFAPEKGNTITGKVVAKDKDTGGHWVKTGPGPDKLLLKSHRFEVIDVPKQPKAVKTPLEDARLATYHEILAERAKEAGWMEEGGKAQFAPDNKFNPNGGQGGGFTEFQRWSSWIPHAPWFADAQHNAPLPKNGDGEATQAAVQKAIAKEPMSKAERMHVTYMLDQLQGEMEGDATPADALDMMQSLETVGEPTLVPTEVDLSAKAEKLDPAAYERAGIQFADDDAGYNAAIRRIVDEHSQSNPQGGEAVQPAAGQAPPERAPGDAPDILVDQNRPDYSLAPKLFVRIGRNVHPVASLKEASQKANAAVMAWFQDGFRGDELPHMDVLDGSGKQIGYISQNGKVWSGTQQEWKSGQKPLYDASVKEQEPLALTTQVKSPEVIADEAKRSVTSAQGDMLGGQVAAAQATPKQTKAKSEPAGQGRLPGIEQPKTPFGENDEQAKKSAVENQAFAGKRPLSPAERRGVFAEKERIKRDAIKSVAELERLFEEGRFAQLEDRAGRCYELASAASELGYGDLVIGHVEETLGDKVWHAVVRFDDGTIYDPTYERGFAKGVFEAAGFEPVKELSRDEVLNFIEKNGTFPSPLGLGLTPKVEQNASQYGDLATLYKEFYDDGTINGDSATVSELIDTIEKDGISVPPEVGKAIEQYQRDVKTMRKNGGRTLTGNPENDVEAAIQKALGYNTGHDSNPTAVPSVPSEKRAEVRNARAEPAPGSGVRRIAERVQPVWRALGIQRELKEQGHAAIIGQKVEGGSLTQRARRVAEIAQVLRNQKYETFRYLFVKNGEIVHASAVTARLPSQVPSVWPKSMTNTEAFNWLRDQMKQSGADGYYMLHNHPSGNPEPSDSDRNTTQFITQNVDGFLGHVIIDSNKFAFLDRYGDGDVVDAHFGPDLLLTPEVPSSIIGKPIDNKQDVAAVGFVLKKPGWVTLIGTSGKTGVRAAMEVPAEQFTHSEHQKDAIREFQNGAGVDRVFAYGDPMTLRNANVVGLMADGWLFEAVTYEGRSFQEMGYPANERKFQGENISDRKIEVTGDKATTSTGTRTPQQQRLPGVEQPAYHGTPVSKAERDQALEQSKPEYGAQTDTPAFKKWFGDSKVVNDDGAPKKMYFGGPHDLERFDATDRPTGGRAAGTLHSQGIWLTANKENASDYAFNAPTEGKNPTLYPVYVSIKNPARVVWEDIYRDKISRDDLIKQGYDGAYFIDTGGWMAFHPEQIKSAIGNNGNFSDSPSIVEQDRPAYSTAHTPAEAQWGSDKFVDKFKRDFERVILDKMNLWRDYEKYLKDSGYDVDESASVYDKEQQMSSKAMDDINQMQRKFTDPLMRAIKASGMDLEKVGTYALARHAKEGNEAIDDAYAVYTGMTDQEVLALPKMNADKFAKLKADAKRLKGRGTGMPTSPEFKTADDVTDAESFMAALTPAERAALDDKIMPILDAMLQARRDRMVESGLITKGVSESWEKKFEFYVPVKTFDPDGRLKLSQGYAVTNTGVKARTGRSTLPVNPVLQAIVDMSRMLVEARKLEVGQAIYRMAVDYPTDLVKAVKPEDLLVRNPVRVNGKIEMRDEIDPFIRSRDDIFQVKVDGKNEYVQITDKMLYRQAKNLGDQKLGDFFESMLQMASMVTKFIGQTITSWNFEWIPINFTKDLQTALINVQAMDGVDTLKLAKAMAKGIPASWKAIGQSLWGKGSLGRLEKEAAKPGESLPTDWLELDKMANDPVNASRKKALSELARLRAYREFEQDGVPTGHYGLDDVDTIARRAERDFKLATASGNSHDIWDAAVRGIIGRNGILSRIRELNEVVENATRFSMYYEARKTGMSRQKTAVAAKNLTVNFNKRGEAGRVLNALYMFFNASVQGSRIMVQNVRKNPKRMLSVMGGMMAAGYLIESLNYLLGGWDDDTGKAMIDIKATEWTRDHYVTIMIGRDNNAIKPIALPYGFSLPYVAGRRMAAATFGTDGIGHSVSGVIKAALDAFNPMGGADSKKFSTWLSKMMAPTILDPIVDISNNENFMGGWIYKESKFSRVAPPPSETALKSTSPAITKTFQAINKFAGGSDDKEGAVPLLYPGAFEHLIKGYLGGLGSVLLAGIDAPFEDKRDRSIAQLPGLRKIIAAPRKGYIGQDYRDIEEELYPILKELKSGPSDQTPEMRRLVGSFEQADRQVTSLRREMSDMKRRNTPDAVIENKQQQIDRVQTQMIRKYNDVMHPSDWRDKAREMNTSQGADYFRESGRTQMAALLESLPAGFSVPT